MILREALINRLIDVAAIPFFIHCSKFPDWAPIPGHNIGISADIDLTNDKSSGEVAPIIQPIFSERLYLIELSMMSS